ADAIPSLHTPSPAETVDAIYNPEKDHDDAQSAMDNLKKRYEDILVTHFFLSKCGKTSPGDYQIITSALRQEMAAVNAPQHLQNDIVSSAQGSYQEIYSH